MSSKSNGTSGKVKVAGRCLDCYVPCEIDQLKVDVEENRSRIELVAHDGDANAASINSLVVRFEMANVALESNLKLLATTLGRIGTRRARRGEEP